MLVEFVVYSETELVGYDNANLLTSLVLTTILFRFGSLKSLGIKFQ